MGVLPEGSCVPGSSLSSGNLASGSGTRARLCLNGVAWSADINEVDARLSISVTFGEDVWKVLQSAAGDDASIASFRDAVDFHLAEEELRVTHVGSLVLDLQLRQPVDPNAAAAKLCSRRRRVTVSAPLR